MQVDVLSLMLYCLFFLVLSLLGIRGRGKWKQRGMVTGFIVALFTEMWGFPLSLFVITTLGGNSQLPYQFDNLMYYFTRTRSSSDVAFSNPPPAWLAEYILARGIALLSLLPIIYGWFYLKKNIIKCEIAVAKGKKVYDRREVTRQRTIDRETKQAISEHRKRG